MFVFYFLFCLLHKFLFIGVIFASAGCGLGEVSYLSLSSHFHRYFYIFSFTFIVKSIFSDVVLSWSSGTGGAGIAGALAFAVLTDHRFLGFFFLINLKKNYEFIIVALTPRAALLFMLVVPFILLWTFWKVLVFPSTVRCFDFCRYFSTFESKYFNYFKKLHKI